MKRARAEIEISTSSDDEVGEPGRDEPSPVPIATSTTEAALVAALAELEAVRQRVASLLAAPAPSHTPVRVRNSIPTPGTPSVAPPEGTPSVARPREEPPAMPDREEETEVGPEPQCTGCTTLVCILVLRANALTVLFLVAARMASISSNRMGGGGFGGVAFRRRSSPLTMF